MSLKPYDKINLLFIFLGGLVSVIITICGHAYRVHLNELFTRFTGLVDTRNGEALFWWIGLTGICSSMAAFVIYGVGASQLNKAFDKRFSKDKDVEEK